MTNSTLKTLSSRALHVTSLLLMASVAFGGEAGAAGTHKNAQPTSAPAQQEIPLIGTMVITAKPSPVILVTDLGAMTVTAPRETVVADLGSMTVSGTRETLVADLGSMTVTGTRDNLVANLGSMTVSAPRNTAVVANLGSMLVTAIRQTLIASN